MELNINEVVKAVGGRLIGHNLDDFEKPLIVNVSTDTRKITKGSLFVPIVGERFDAHDYIPAAAEQGAICAFTEKENLAGTVNIPLIYVASTRRALLDLAGYYRRMHDITVVAITGSAGKTTTKDMIYHVLSRKYKTKKTLGNFNNEIGLPLSIFQLEKDDEVLVLEMGMNHAGEIHELSLTGAPDIAVITHIGDAHIENFENREGILHAKLEIVDGLRSSGTVILNGDDPLLTGEISKEKTGLFEVLYPSAENILKSEAVGIQESRCHFNWQGVNMELTVPIPGAHMVMNALLAAAVGVKMGVTAEDIAQGFEDFTPASGRLTVETANDMTIINDVYNANPAAMAEAIKILCKQTARKVAILGDMSELGHVAEARHRETGQFAAEAGVDLLIAIGELSRHMYEGFLESNPVGNNPSGKAMHLSNSDEFLAQWRDILKPGDVVLVKASRSMAFENITNTLAVAER